MENWNAYHFTGNNLRDGRPVPAVGETLVHEGPIFWCESGLYASRTAFDALQYAPGPILHRVTCEDVEREEHDKLVCRRRTIVASVDATGLLREFARKCALYVIHLWDAPGVVRRYLETGDESLRASAEAAEWEAAWRAEWEAARRAAWGTAWAAARDAAWAAARASAWEAAWEAAGFAAEAAAGAAEREKQAAHFNEMVNNAFEKESP